MDINIRFIPMEDKLYIRYEDDKGLKLWIPEGYPRESLKSFFEKLYKIYKVTEI